MVKPPSSSVLLLELEDLKKHMVSVQSEAGRCLASLTAQSQEVCEVFARLETVNAIVRAELTVNWKKKEKEEISFQDPLLERFVDYNDLAAAESRESFGAFREGEFHLHAAGEQSDQSDMNYRTEGCNQPCKPEILNIRVTSGMKEAGEGSEVISENDEIDKFGDISNLDGDLLSTRPSLSKNCRKNVKEKRNLPEYFNEEATTGTTASNSAKVTSSSESSCFLNTSEMVLPSNITGCPASSNLKLSTSSIVNTVKDICSKQGWEAAGSYSTIEGKEACSVVHFYQLKVNGGVKDLMTGGVGLSKVKAVRRAFKTMQNMLNGKEEERVDDISDNSLNFLDEEPMMEVESGLSSDMSPSPPPLCHSTNFEALGKSSNQLGVKSGRVKKTLTVSDSIIGRFIGIKGNKLKNIYKETGVDISIGDLEKGSQDRLVELWGEEACVDEALEMIRKHLALTINMKLNLMKLTVSNDDAGAIIGTKGSNMHRIIEETGVNIIVDGLVKGKDRMVELWGEKAFVDKALEMITEILALNMMKTKENLITLTVSHHDAGAIIGTKRTQLNRIIEDTGVNIKVEGLVKGNLDRLVELWGHKVSVDKALQMIKKILQR